MNARWSMTLGTEGMKKTSLRLSPALGHKMGRHRYFSAGVSPTSNTLPLHRISVSISSWFRLADQGMLQHEMLCRGTAFGVRLPQRKSKHAPLIFFTCSHVAAPWRWPKLYPVPWLEHVREEHSRCVLHVTEVQTGRVLERFLMDSNVVHHDSLDVCALRLQDQEKVMQRMAMHGLPLHPLVLSERVPSSGNAVVSPGFAVERVQRKADDGSMSDGEDGEYTEVVEDLETGGSIRLDLRTDQEPRRLCVSMGTVSHYKDRQARGFAVMDRVLGDGVCGAPLLDLRQEGRCVGLVEGIVPPLEEGAEARQTGSGLAGREVELRKAIAGNAGFIYGQQLIDLLEKVSGNK